MILDVKHY